MNDENELPVTKDEATEAELDTVTKDTPEVKPVEKTVMMKKSVKPARKPAQKSGTINKELVDSWNAYRQKEGLAAALNKLVHFSKGKMTKEEYQYIYNMLSTE